MDSTDQNIKSIITRFLEGEASEKEIAMLEEWLRRNKSNRVYFDELNTAYQASVTMSRFHQQKTDDAWSRISQRMQKEQKKDNVVRGQFSFSLLKIAASVTLVVLSGYLAYQFFDPGFFSQTQNSVVVNTQRNGMEIKLPDGSRVWLNTNSTLEYNPEFGKSIREVRLKGEAFFDVQKDSKPFVVKTGAMEVHVKGTRFNVEAYRSDSSARTTLEEGKVELHVTGRTPVYTMYPGDQIILNTTRSEVVRKKVNPSNFTAWKEPRLVFDNTPLENIIAKLENRYRVRIVADEFLARTERLTMTIEDENLDEVLELIRLSSHLKTKKEKNHIVLFQ